MKTLKSLVIIGSLMLANTSYASSVAWSVTGNTVIGIGDQINSGLDTLNLSNNNGLFTANGVYDLSTITFHTDYNENTPQTTPVTGNLGFSVTVAGETKSVNLDYSWTSPLADMSLDIISFLPLSPLTFSNGTVVNFSTPAILNSDNANLTVSEPLTATISTVPVPTAAWLFGSALLGLFGVKRKNA